jgi:hypothetical protein
MRGPRQHRHLSDEDWHSPPIRVRLPTQSSRRGACAQTSRGTHQDWLGRSLAGLLRAGAGWPASAPAFRSDLLVEEEHLRDFAEERGALRVGLVPSAPLGRFLEECSLVGSKVVDPGAEVLHALRGDPLV